MRRFHRDEDGFALVTALGIMVVMTLLLVVVLAAGEASFNNAERNSRFTRTLGIAEAGVNDAITMLGEAGTPTNPCPIDSSPAQVCQATDGHGVPNGEYQVSWTQPSSSGAVTIQSIGYYPNMATEQISRKVQVVLEPVQSFKYALYSNTTLDIKNNEIVIGDVYANQKVTLGTNAILCGSVVNVAGGVETQNGASVVKGLSGALSQLCSGKNGKVWSGGTITLNQTGIVQGDAKASYTGPCPNAAYSIVGGTVQGVATACGSITATGWTSKSESTVSSPPAAEPMPPYTFDASKYTGLVCYGSGSTCSETSTSSTAVSSFATVSRMAMKGSYAIWQTQPTQSTQVSLDGLTIGGDLTIVTNAPIDFGNVTNVTLAPGVTSADLEIISLYIPPTGTTCDTNGGDCSIYAKNKVTFDAGDATDPDDGIVALLYTPGKMAFKNTGGNGASCTSGDISSMDGAMYAGSMDLNNCFRVTYNTRIERAIGFGSGLEQTLWQEISG